MAKQGREDQVTEGFGWGLARWRQHEALCREQAEGFRASAPPELAGNALVRGCQEEAAHARRQAGRIARMQLRVRPAGAW